MKVFVLFHPLDTAGPVWRNGFWSNIDLLSRISDVSELHTPWPQTDASLARRSMRWLREHATGRQLAHNVHQLSDRDEPAMLFTIALQASQVRMSATAAQAPGLSHRVLYVVENIEPEQAPLSAWQSFDHIISFCPDLAVQLQEATGVPTSYWPPHTDVLGFCGATEYRPIDILSYGRLQHDLIFALQQRTEGPEKELLYVDFATRSLPSRQQPAEREFRLLMDMLSKSRATLCFAPDRVPRFQGRSPLLERWVHAWTAGCVVFGTRPSGTGVAKSMDWHGSMIDLPSDPKAAAHRIQTVLADRDWVIHQSQVNRYEALCRHDTRYRLAELLSTLGIRLPDRLERELTQLTDYIERSRVALASAA